MKTLWFMMLLMCLNISYLCSSEHNTSLSLPANGSEEAPRASNNLKWDQTEEKRKYQREYQREYRKLPKAQAYQKNYFQQNRMRRLEYYKNYRRNCSKEITNQLGLSNPAEERTKLINEAQARRDLPTLQREAFRSLQQTAREELAREQLYELAEIASTAERLPENTLYKQLNTMTSDSLEN